MKRNKTDATLRTVESTASFVTRGKAAAKVMSKTLREEHKRWHMPLLSWEKGKIVATDP